MTVKEYINFHKKNTKMLNLERSFQFLDDLLDLLEKKKKTELDVDLEKDIIIYNYNTNNNFYVNSVEAQETFDDFYHHYYFDFFIKKYDSCKKIITKTSARMPKEVNADFAGLLYFKLILLSIQFSADLKSISFTYEEFLCNLHKTFKNMFKLDDTSINEVVVEVIKGLIEDKFLLKQGNDLALVDDSIRLDLMGMSLIPVRINKASEFDIKYSCYYGLSILQFICYKYLLTANHEYHKYLLNKYSNDIEKYSILEKNLESHESLDFSKFNKNYFNKDPYNIENHDYIMLCTIYVDKLILNQFYFHTIINSCFKEYFFSKRHNILYDKSYALCWRLNL